MVTDRSLGFIMLKAVIAALLVLPVQAPAAEPPASIATHKIISAVEGDFNGDGSRDRAILIDGGDSNADIAIYFNDGNGGFKAAGTASAIAFNGGLFGNSPDLRLSKTGALQVHSENIAIGRDHWERTLTLSYRGGQFVVSGITASGYDTMNPKDSTACDLNLLTGKGLSGRKKVTVKAGAVPLGQWNDDKGAGDLPVVSRAGFPQPRAQRQRPTCRGAIAMSPPPPAAAGRQSARSFRDRPGPHRGTA